MVRLAVGTGLRLGEICHLRWDAVNLDDGHLVVRASEGFDTKSGHQRVVPFAGETRRMLGRLHAERGAEGGYVFRGARGGRLNLEYVSKRFLSYARGAGLEGVRFHTLRHTYASWMVMAGVDLYRVQKLMGHASIETTARYAHLAPTALRADVNRVFGEDEAAGRVGEPAARYGLAA